MPWQAKCTPCGAPCCSPPPPAAPPHLGIIPKRQFLGGASFRQISPFHSSFPWCLFPIFSSPLIPDLFRGRQGDHAGWVGSLIRTSSIFPCCLPCPIQRVCPRGKRFHFLGWGENVHFSHTAPISKDIIPQEDQSRRQGWRDRLFGSYSDVCLIEVCCSSFIAHIPFSLVLCYC